MRTWVRAIPRKNVINNTYQNSKLLSFYGRLNYVLDDKYLFTFTMRADGSSKFGKKQQVGLFPFGRRELETPQ